MTLGDAIDSLAEEPLRCLLAADAGESLAQAAAARIASRPIVLLIGPEGGLADNEQSFALANGFTAARLGPRVMRTETAGLAAIAVLQALAGDFR
jgi:16S rRNA (uracil1498-N3)-methyltransferase